MEAMDGKSPGKRKVFKVRVIVDSLGTTLY